MCDQRGTLGLFVNKQPRKKTTATVYDYPYVTLRGTQLLLGRLYDFFRLYSAYPQAASEQFLKQIDDEKGCVNLTGTPAQMAVYNLYHGAHVGAWMDRASDVLDWRPHTGWGIGVGPGCHNPARRDLSGLRPIPADLFDAKR